jgi:GTP-binding protein
LINAVARARLARTSAAPGKTRLANLYRFTVDGGPGGPGRWSVHLVDLPGYGYARGGQSAVRELAAIAEAYFSEGRAPGTGDGPSTGSGRPEFIEGRSDAAVRPPYVVAGVLHLVDGRHPDMDADKQAADWLATLGVERVLVATKIDKLSRAERAKNLGHLERKLGMAALPLSAVGGEGLDDLWKLIAKLSRHR